MSSQLWTPPADLVLPEDVDLDRVLPRVCYFPEYAYSSGMEAIEIAQSAGLVLDIWQQLCIQLGLGETAEGRWAAFQVALIVARQNGKGSILEALELFWLFGTQERLIGHSAHEYKTAMEAFRRLLSLITNTDYLRKKVKKVINTNGEEGIELLTGQRIRFIARSKGAGRGFTFDKLVWDEAYALTPEHQEAQLPTLSAVPNAQIWITSSPPLDSATGVALFRLRAMVEQQAKRLTFLDYGLEGSLERLDQIDMDDRALWLKSNPAAPHRISLEAMEIERDAMGDRGFARERLCIWPPDLSQGYTVITKEQWNALKDEHSGKETYEGLPADTKYWPQPDLPLSDPCWTTPPTKLVRRPALAIRVGVRGYGQPPASICLAQLRFDGKKHVEVIKNGTGSKWLIRDTVALVKKIDPCCVVLDPGSPTGSILGDLEAAFKAEELDTEIIVKMTARDVGQAFGIIYDAATSDKEVARDVTHLGQYEIDQAVAGADTRPVGDGTTWDTRNPNVDLTPLSGITDALWGLATHGAGDDFGPMVAWG